MVTAGHTSRSLREARKEKSFQSFGVKEFYYHPKYDRKPNRFDILLIEIKPLQALYNNPANNFGWTFTKKVQPLCISDTHNDEIRPRDHCFIQDGDSRRLERFDQRKVFNKLVYVLMMSDALTILWRAHTEVSYVIHYYVQLATENQMPMHVRLV